MSRHFFYSLILLALACQGGMDQSSSPGAEVKDSGQAKQLLNPGDAVVSEGYTEVYVEIGKLTARNVDFSFQSRYTMPGSSGKDWVDSSRYHSGNYLIVRDKAAKVADTMEYTEIQKSRFTMQDMTDSLKFKSILIQLAYDGDSDQPASDFIEYKNGKLKRLFSMVRLDSLARKDANTLVGIVIGWDEIVAGNMKTLITVSLPDGAITEHIPDIQYIGNWSKALEPLKAYRERKGDVLSNPYIIKQDSELTIDTFYRKKGLVRMMVNDSIPVYMWKDSLNHEKIVVNTAG